MTGSQEKERKAAEAAGRLYEERKRMRAEAAQIKQMAEAAAAAPAPVTLSKRPTDKSASS